MRISIFAAIILLTSSVTVQASVTLQSGDTVKYLGQASGQSEGNGGAFNWQIASVLSSPPSSPVGSTFQTFCVELQQSIAYGRTYTVSSVVVPTLGQPFNSSGNLLNNFKGIYLFEEWSDGTMSKTSANAAAVQIALWESEGYNLTANYNSLLNTAGYTTTEYYNAKSLITYWLSRSLQDGTIYSTTWTPDNVNAFDLKCGSTGAQDQVVLIPVNNHHTSGSVPELASVAVWGIGAVLACAYGLRRRKA